MVVEIGKDILWCFLCVEEDVPAVSAYSVKCNALKTGQERMPW
jgi:hypothetical protein